MTRRLLPLLLPVLLLGLLSACAKNLKPDEVMGGPLNYLQEGKTTREEALGKMKIESAKAPIERLINSPDENVRVQAKKALKRLA